jgi:hypothetical protein
MGYESIGDGWNMFKFTSFRFASFGPFVGLGLRAED